MSWSHATQHYISHGDLCSVYHNRQKEILVTEILRKYWREVDSLTQTKVYGQCKVCSNRFVHVVQTVELGITVTTPRSWVLYSSNEMSFSLDKTIFQIHKREGLEGKTWMNCLPSSLWHSTCLFFTYFTVCKLFLFLLFLHQNYVPRTNSSVILRWKIWIYWICLIKVLIQKANGCMWQNNNN